MCSLSQHGHHCFLSPCSVQLFSVSELWCLQSCILAPDSPYPRAHQWAPSCQVPPLPLSGTTVISNALQVPRHQTRTTFSAVFKARKPLLAPVNSGGRPSPSCYTSSPGPQKKITPATSTCDTHLFKDQAWVSCVSISQSPLLWPHFFIQPRWKTLADIYCVPNIVRTLQKLLQFLIS